MTIKFAEKFYQKPNAHYKLSQTDQITFPSIT